MPTEIVTQFLRQWGISNEALIASIEDYFTDETVFENVGLGVTTGIGEAIDLIKLFKQTTDLATVEIETLNIAANGDTVLTERVDTLFSSTGAFLSRCRLMGVFKVKNAKIVEWRDYFDTATTPTAILEPGREFTSQP